MFSALVAMKSAVVIITLYFFGCTGEVEELFAQFLLHLFPVGGVAQVQVVPQGLDSVNGSSVNMGCTSSLVDSDGVLVCESRSYLVDGCSPDINTSTSDWASQLVTVRRDRGNQYVTFPHVLLTFGFDTAVSLTGIVIDLFNCPDWGIGAPYITVYLNEDYNLANTNIRTLPFVFADNKDSLQSSCDSLSTVTFSGGQLMGSYYRAINIMVDISQYPSIEWVHVGEVRFIFLRPTCSLSSSIMLSSSTLPSLSISCESVRKPLPSYPCKNSTIQRVVTHEYLLNWCLPQFQETERMIVHVVMGPSAQL